MRFCKRTSYLLLITTIFYLISGCKITRPSFPFHPSISETTFYAQVSDSGFTAPELINENFLSEQKKVRYSLKKVNSSTPNILSTLPLKNSGIKNFRPSFIGTNSNAIESKLIHLNNEQHQKVLTFNSSSKKQNKVPGPLLIAIVVLTLAIIGFFIAFIKTTSKISKNGEYILKSIVLLVFLLLSLITWITLIVHLLLLVVPPIYFAIFLAVLILGFFIWKGIKNYFKYDREPITQG